MSRMQVEYCVYLCKDAVFKTTPWLAFRYGHAARVRKNQVYFFPQIAVPFLVGDVFELVEVRHRGVVEQHVDPGKTTEKRSPSSVR